MGNKQVITAVGSSIQVMTAQEELDHAPLSAAAHLAEVKRIAREKIDAAAEAARLRYVTSGAAQAMTYQVKGDQADAYILAGYPADLTGYQFIQAEINATGKTKEAAADDIVAQRDAWLTIGASIEEERLGGKVAVDVASDENSVQTTMTTVVAALGAI